MRVTPAGEQLRAWRKAKGWTLQQMTNHLGPGWHLQNLHDIETGKQTPGLKRAADIEDITGIPLRAWLAAKRAA